MYRPGVLYPSMPPYTGSFFFTFSRRLKLRNNKLPINTVSVSGPAYPTKGESTSALPYPAIQASTHCHQCPSIPPAILGYFGGILISLFRDSGSNLGAKPPHPHDTLPFVPINKVPPS